jgi:hypothetical protein
MRPAVADWLCRQLVAFHPRRWRERYRQEMLDVLDQHQVSAWTVLDLAGSALSAHADPAYRMAGFSMARLRRAAAVPAMILTSLVLVFGLLVAFAAWQERWHLSGEGGVSSVAFAPGRDLLVSAVGVAHQDSMDTVWDIADPARPRQLSAFQGGEPTVLSPDGRVLATVSFGGQPVLWSPTDPGRPARIAVVPSDDGNALWGEAFSPNGGILAVAYTDRIYLWDVASPTRPRLLRTPVMSLTTPPPYGPQEFAFSPDGRILAMVTGTDQATLWNVTDPARAARIATVTGPRDSLQAIAFSPRGNLLAGVTYHGIVLVFSLADPARPVLTTTIGGIMPEALWPDGLLQHPDAPPCPSCGLADYAVGFAPDGRSLTVVVERQESSVSGNPAITNDSRDTVFSWNLTGSGAVTGFSTAFRNVVGDLPALAPDGRTVVDGAPHSNAVYLWTLP